MEQEMETVDATEGHLPPQEIASDDARLLDLIRSTKQENGEDDSESSSETDSSLEVAQQPKPKKTAQSEEDITLQQRLAARREKFSWQKQAQEEKRQLDQYRQELDQHRQYLESQWRQEQQKLAEERSRYERLKTNPIDAIKEIGWSVEDLTKAVSLDGSPEWHFTQNLKKEYDTYRKTQEEALSTMRKELEDLKAYRSQYEQQASQASRAQAERLFMTEHAAADKCPSMHALWEPEEIINQAHHVAETYQQRTGRVADMGEIAEYLEGQAKHKLDRIASLKQASGEPTKAKGNGPRALSSQAVSERRGTPKHIDDMTPQEEREHMLSVLRGIRQTRESANKK